MRRIQCLLRDFCIMHHESPRSGFTLLFSVLIGSLLFSVGMAIANLATREVVLSAAGKESEAAFFAADTGVECTLYWDRRGNKFPVGGPPSSFSCAKETIFPTLLGSVFSFTLKLEGTTCALVRVDKTTGTVIESRGRNDCGSGDNPARVERALRVRY